MKLFVNYVILRSFILSFCYIFAYRRTHFVSIITYIETYLTNQKESNEED